MQSRFVAGVDLPNPIDGNPYWFVIQRSKVLVFNTPEVMLPNADHLLSANIPRGSIHYLGRLGRDHVMVAEAPESWEPESSWGFLPLRQLHGLLPDDLYGLAGRAVQIVDWDRNHRFCGRCAAPTESVAHERAKRCPGCELVVYPRISPAVIVLVERDEKILLARAHSFSGNFYSVLAGFVEAGEALEEAVSREIAEEVGIQVQDIRYFGSQPWPFPNSLMIGFTARHAAGEIQIDEREIADAGWFRPEELPELPGKISIARRLIDAWLENR